MLIDQGQILSALKLSQENVSPRKFLEAAQNSGDHALFHSTLYCFKSNPQYANAFLKGALIFFYISEFYIFNCFLDERLGYFIQYYNTIFPDSNLDSK